MITADPYLEEVAHPHLYSDQVMTASDLACISGVWQNILSSLLWMSTFYSSN